MSNAAPSETVGRQVCWEHILRTNPLFRVSQLFADPGSADRLLPLYALFSAVEQACTGISDHEVAFRKLEWWREECLVRDMAESDHPILQELGRTGAAGRLRPDALARLITGAQSRLDSAAPADMDELRILCVSVGGAQLELEAGICGLQADSPVPEFEGLAAQNGLVQLIREGGIWWLPLQLLARHGISRSDIRQNVDSDGVQALFGEVISASEAWKPGAELVPGPATELMPGFRHALVINGLYARKLSGLGKLQPSRYRAALMKAGIPELFAAWKTARRVSRR